MLIGRKIGQYNQKIVRPGSASLTLSGKAPSIGILPPLLFLNYFEGTVPNAGPFVDEVSSITWTVDNDGGDTVFNGSDKFGNTSAYIPASFPGANTLECGDFDDLANESWTVEGWVLFEGASNLNNFQFAINKLSSHSANISMNVNLTATLAGCAIKLSSSGGDIETSSTFDLSAETWYHMAFQYDLDNDNYECYFNGTRYIQSNGNGTVAENSNDFMITHNIGSFGVRIGEVRGIKGLIYSGGTYSVPTSSF